MTLETLFTGNAYGFEIQVKDDCDTKVDAGSVAVSVDGIAVETNVNQADGVTVITGQNPTLLPQETAHTVSLTLDAGGTTQSKDFVFNVDVYTLLPADSRVPAIKEGESKRGLMVGVTQISSSTTELSSVHETCGKKKISSHTSEVECENDTICCYMTKDNMRTSRTTLCRT